MLKLCEYLLILLKSVTLVYDRLINLVKRNNRTIFWQDATFNNKCAYNIEICGINHSYDIYLLTTF